MPASLVSVIIPAHNAARTLDQTLASARAQSYQSLEIIVVDDGSTDATAERVLDHAARDPRVRLIRQANAGVASARNRAMADATGDYIAPLDADDLWHPEKIERQLRALQNAGDRAALAYGWFRRIDMADRVIAGSPCPRIEGRVLHRHLDWNFISNGSTPLVHASVARAVGFDPVLHQAGNQGCEDYLFQLRIARDHGFVCVPAYLTGYRIADGAMSGNSARMMRSHVQALDLMRPVVGPAARRLIDRRRAAYARPLARMALRQGRWGDAAAMVGLLLRAGPGALLRPRNRPVPTASTTDRPFDDWDAVADDGAWQTARSEAWMAHLAQLDAALP
ncbi:glycosyltransferase family 2 protein [Sphingomonas sp. FW199]|uniref:glycosyltransferase family 2 protein n=1 Tax=Sphingomonas sp. FW199 TaxID=3400217 RepID=UPI003CF719FA